MDLAQYLKILVALTVIVDPAGLIPVFLGLTEGQTETEQRKTAFLAPAVAMAVLVGAALFGKDVLNFFGVSIPSFTVAGGILLVAVAIAMVNARVSGTRQSAEERREDAEREDVAIVPIAIPLLAGPGAITAVILYSDRAATLFDRGFVVIACLLVGGIVFLALRFASAIGEKLGRTGINVVTRLFGIVLLALGVEFIADGIVALLPGLAG